MALKRAASCLRALRSPSASPRPLITTGRKAAFFSRCSTPQWHPLQRQSSPYIKQRRLRSTTSDPHSNPPPIQSYTYDQVRSMIDSDDHDEPSFRPSIIIDVREPHELQKTGRIPTAENVPISSSPEAFFLPEDEFEERFGFQMPPKQPSEGETDEQFGGVVFYCKAGVRSRAAAVMAQQAGWRDVGSYAGSMDEWIGRGGEVEGKGESPR
ncbi:hypothetical protein MMC25_001963 [Agyrium rufum]|nr:hypothetical protein [Agyrium rufum]